MLPVVLSSVSISTSSLAATSLMSTPGRLAADALAHSATSQYSPLASALSAFSQNAAGVGLLWIGSSAIFTTYTATRFLKYSPTGPLATGSTSTRSTPRQPLQNIMSRPTRLTLYRFAGSFAIGLLLHPNFDVTGRLAQTIAATPAFFVSALLLFLANLANSVALDRIGIPLTYTCKCGIPLMTVILTLIMDGPSALPPPLALIALVPIAFGIAAASWSAPTFELAGFLAALFSTLTQSALNVFSKRAFVKTGISGASAQRVMAGIGLVLTITMTIVQQSLAIYSSWARKNTRRRVDAKDTNVPPTWLSLSAIVAYHAEYVLSFMFVKLVQPITFGTCDAIRRLAIIVAGKRMFGGSPLTKENWFGIFLALIGALSYSIATN